MITLTFGKVRGFNERTNKIYWLPGGTFKFENSLKAITLWEQKYRVPWLKKDYERTDEQVYYFCYCMCLDDNFDIRYLYDNPEMCIKLIEYANDSPTATTVISDDNDKKGPVLTSEVIYAYMAMSQVPYTAETWNIVNLLMVLTCITELSNPDKESKESQEEIYAQFDDQNARLRAEFGMD